MPVPLGTAVERGGRTCCRLGAEPLEEEASAPGTAAVVVQQALRLASHMRHRSLCMLRKPPQFSSRVTSLGLLQLRRFHEASMRAASAVAPVVRCQRLEASGVHRRTEVPLWMHELAQGSTLHDVRIDGSEDM